MKKLFAVLCMMFIFCGQVEAAGVMRNGRLWENVIRNSITCQKHRRHNCAICAREQRQRQQQRRQNPAKQMRPQQSIPTKL